MFNCFYHIIPYWCFQKTSKQALGVLCQLSADIFSLTLSIFFFFFFKLTGELIFMLCCGPGDIRVVGSYYVQV